MLYDGLGDVEDADQVDHVDVDDVSNADGDDVRKASTINTLILSQYDGDDENIQNFHHHPHNPRHCPIKKIIVLIKVLIIVLIILLLIIVIIIRRGGCEKSVCGKAVLCSPHNQVFPSFPFFRFSHIFLV